jgi:hypothetical protein
MRSGFQNAKISPTAKPAVGNRAALLFELESYHLTAMALLFSTRALLTCRGQADSRSRQNRQLRKQFHEFG